jgi:Ca-activated chloride channel homolog
MHLTGLPLATLIQIGAVLGTIVVVSYILKLKRRPIAVPFSKLWERILREKEATSLFSQLKRLMSLLLQLALLTLLLFALGDPRTAAAVLEGRNLVVLVDTSASMSATDGLPTRLDQAREETRKIIRGMGGSDRALIAQMDASVTPLSTMTSDLPTLEGAASSLRATDTRADFPRALRFALDTLRGHARQEIVVISDGRLGEPHDAYGTVNLGDVRLTYVKVGQRSRNAAISQFSVRRYPLDKSRYEVMIEVANTSDDPLDVELSLVGDGNLVDLTKFRIAGHEKLPRFYPNLSGASRALEAKLTLQNGERDDLPIDDHAYALLPERRRARVLCVTKGNTYLEAALLLDEYLDVHTIAPADYPVLQGEFDVTIFDNFAPPVAKNSGHVFYINPSGKDSPVEVKGTLDDAGFDVWDKKSPLLRWTAIADINIAKANKLAIDKDDKIVGGSFKGPLLVMGRRGAQRFVALAFDLRDSDLPLRISWPLLLLNTINDFVEEDTSYISSFRTGDVWRIPVPADARDALLTMPDESSRTIPVLDGHAVFVGQHAGFYRLKAGPVGSEVETSFAANLSDLEESTIGPAPELKVGEAVGGVLEGFKVGVRREIWIYLLAAALIMTTIEWITYHRRLTV